jgi:hypothetical protein
MHFTNVESSTDPCGISILGFTWFNSKLIFMLARVERSPSLSITFEAFTWARQIPTKPTPEPTSKHDLPENISGNERMNSDKKRLEGHIEHPVSPSSMFSEHCRETINFVELGQLE